MERKEAILTPVKLEMESNVYGTRIHVCMYVLHFFEVCLYRSNDGMVIQVGNRAFMSNNNISLSNAVQENLWNLEVRALPYVSIPDTIFICIYLYTCGICIRDLFIFI